MINLATILDLTRPLAVLDLETTGVDDTSDRICQIAVTIHYQDKDPIQWETLINPQCEIPKDAQDVHGISTEDVQGKPIFSQVGSVLGPYLLAADIAGYNVDFDIRFLRAEMKRANISWSWDNFVIDGYQIWVQQESRSLTDAFRKFVDTELKDSHNAGVDVATTEAVLRGQLLRWQTLPRDVEGLSVLCFPRRKDAIDSHGKFVWVHDVPCIAFGKWAKNGPYPMHKVDDTYWQFILKKDFAPDCKELALNAMNGVYPIKEK